MMSTIRIVILGDRKVGKSAVTVRFLTRRYIGEYSSDIDLMYRSSIRLEDILTDIEVLDTCTSPEQIARPHDIRASWADAFVVVYSILSRPSFHTARALIETISRVRTSTCIPMTLLGNMTDLDHRREVGVGEGLQVALEFGCQYFEVSAASAEGIVGIDLAFQAFLREARLVQNHRSSLVKRRRSSLSRRIGAMFGKKDSNSNSGSESPWPRRGSDDGRDSSKS